MAELFAILADNEFNRDLLTVTTLGPSLTRAEIEAVRVENSLVATPVNGTTFYVIDATRQFFVHYLSSPDRYFYMELNEAI